MALETVSDYFDHLEEKGIDPFSLVQGEKKRPEEYLPPYVDNAEGRLLRALGQKEIEDTFESHIGLSSIERCIDIREKLFKPFSSLYGENPEKPRGVSVSNSFLVYPNEILVQEKLFPGFTRLLDQLYEECLATKDLKVRSERGQRLAATAYTVGILIHPYVDGNGQTMRMLSMSYLKEFCPQYKDLEFKLKLGGRGELATLASFDENDFLITFEREKKELRDYDVLREIKDILPSYKNGIPFSLNGLKVFNLVKAINSEVKSPREAYEFLMKRDSYLTEHLGDNKLFIKRQAEEKLKAVAELKGGFIFPTVDSDGISRLNILNHKHEDFYRSVVELFQEAAPEPIYFNNAVDTLVSESAKLKTKLDNLSDYRLHSQTRDLELFLSTVVSPKGVSYFKRLVRDSLSPSEKSMIAGSLAYSFIKDITSNKNCFLESSKEHQRSYKNVLS